METRKAFIRRTINVYCGEFSFNLTNAFSHLLSVESRDFFASISSSEVKFGIRESICTTKIVSDD